MATAQIYMTRIGLSICITIGNVGCAIGLFVFLQKSMRKNSCVLFLIGYMISNLVYINFTILNVLLSGYGINYSIQSNAFCCIRMYISFVFSIIPTYLLVMASFDRMCITSSNVNTRLKMNKHFSLYTIGGISLFWSLFHLHAIFFSKIQLLYGIKLTCNTQPGGATAFVSYYSFICDGTIPILLMTIFGIQTLINIKQARRIRVRSKDRFLIILLIIQLSMYIFLRVPTPIYLIYQEITQSNIKTSNQIIIEQFIFFIVLFCQFIQVTISPLINLVSNSFRIEFKRVINKMIGQTNQHNLIDVSHRQIRNRMIIKMRGIKEYCNNTNAVIPLQN